MRQDCRKSSSNSNRGLKDSMLVSQIWLELNSLWRPNLSRSETVESNNTLFYVFEAVNNISWGSLYVRFYCTGWHMDWCSRSYLPWDRPNWSVGITLAVAWGSTACRCCLMPASSKYWICQIGLSLQYILRLPIGVSFLPPRCQL